MDNRRDDWAASVDERLVNLTSAQKSADTDLDDLRLELLKVDRILRGDPERDLDGLIEMIKEHQKEINKFNALLNPDHLGQGGLLNDLREVLGSRQRSEKREGYLWKFATAVVVQFLILIGLIVVNWDKIQEYVVLHQHIHAAAAIEKNTKKLKARRARKVKTKSEPATEEQGQEAVQADDAN